MELLSILLSGAAGAGLTTIIQRNREDRPNPKGLADELQWGFLVDDGVVLQKDGALLAGYRYRGPDLGSATGAELDALATQLNDALLPYTDGWMFHVDAIRSPAPPYPASVFPNVVTAWIDAERREAFRSSRPQYVTEYTLCVTYLPPRELYSRAAQVFVQGAPRGIDWQAVLDGYRRALDVLQQRLGRLQVERLDSDALVSHLHSCLTSLSHPVIAPPHGAYLASVLASKEVIGGFAPRVGEHHLRIVALTAYPPSAGAGILDFLNTLPCSYRWSSRFIPLGHQAAERLIKRHQRNWFMGRRGVGSILRDIASKDSARAERREAQDEQFFHDADKTRMAIDAGDAIGENSSGVVRFGFATQAVILADTNESCVEMNARAVVTALQDHGFTARIETVNAIDAFFGTLPGHGTPNLRRPLLNTRNVAALWPVTAVWSGLAHNPSQYFPSESPPLMHVATNGSTPFRLNLHVNDVGHTLVVGATGAGKSTFVGLTIAQWQRYERAKTFVFDVGHSHWLLAKAVGAQHYDVGADQGDVIAFQPLADIDRPDERAWAATWLEELLDLQGIVVTPQRRVRIERALQLVADQPREYRTLTEFTVQLQDRDLVDALRSYTIGGTYGRLLDANRDGVGTARYQVFELKTLLDMDDKVLVPVLLYLFRRVERQLDGAPTLIVIEELWAPLMRTKFAERIRQWLLTLRKQNVAVMLVAHSLAQLAAVPSKQLMIESCPTRILLPNADARDSETAQLYAELGLNAREIALITEAIPKREYYIKSPIGSRLVQLELGSVALAFLGTPPGQTSEEVRPTVTALAHRYGTAWPARWLEQLDVPIPSGVPSEASLLQHDPIALTPFNRAGQAVGEVDPQEDLSYAVV